CRFRPVLFSVPKRLRVCADRAFLRCSGRGSCRRCAEWAFVVPPWPWADGLRAFG
ncbi:MAG: hypothetical protein AVDCRST_MAG08-1825, partial [uncultured Acetobacteraceae bacterium]